VSPAATMPASNQAGPFGAGRKAPARAAPTEPPGTRRKTAGAPPEFSTPSRVSEIQRQRILAAMAEVTAEQGAAGVTVAHIVARSGVSRRTFYELFSDRDDCLLATLELAGRRAREAVEPAYRGGAGRSPARTPPRGGHPKGHRQAGWREAMRAGLTALLGFFDEEPALARLCVVESLAAGPRALELRTRVVRALIDAVEGGRGESRPGGREAPPLTGEGVVGAVLAVIHARLVEPSSKPLSPLAPALMSMIVAPYLGPASAEKELQQPAPQLKTKPRPRRDPLDGLDMRLTYRTVRVLIAIADHPRASNRGVASAAGIADQGQISKLLMRLQNLGLIHNEGEGQPKGAANAWALTAKGTEVERSIRMESASG
jgi:AcrR family transcriptional regulator